ncbi:13898_t:CDS:2 [Cetraspora pellucida]|uniref:13898_t:CDS:1 n=1 Tax=Cetraspora pellucida TaxID=1433469 RepID=A0A9N8VUF0_9GLOM|nr:13898_t:CDS:2 [Cetraspora pellucida]
MYNELCSEDIKAFAKALDKNNILTFLELNNWIAIEEEKALARAIAFCIVGMFFTFE